MAEPGSPAEVLIVGGGVAALEALMALRDLAGDRVRAQLVAHELDFVYRPMSVAEPFGLGEARRHPLRRIADHVGAGLVQAAVPAVDGCARLVVLRSGDTLPFDTPVLAPGARLLSAFDDAVTFTGPGSGAVVRALLDDLEQGRVRRIAFVAPTVTGRTLPLYELALLTAQHAAGRALPRELSLITPEPRPLAIFGERASAAVAELLAAAAIEFVAATQVDVGAGLVRVVPGGRELPVDRVVALPLVRGPKLEGVPVEPEFGVVEVDRHGRVAGLDAVYAAGGRDELPGQARRVGRAAGGRGRGARRRAPRRSRGSGAVPPGAARFCCSREARRTTCARPSPVGEPQRRSHCGGPRRRSRGAISRPTCTNGSPVPSRDQRRRASPISTCRCPWRTRRRSETERSEGTWPRPGSRSSTVR